MRTRRAYVEQRSYGDELEISEAAIAAYARLRRLVGGRIETHPAADGGLICEKRRKRSRPTLWRVTVDGEILADTPYSYATQTFVAPDAPDARCA
jgi:hypothetical protein